MRIRSKRSLYTLFIALCATSLHATILLNDSFETSRSTEDLPDSAKWIIRGTAGTALTTESNTLKYTSSAATVNILSYFTSAGSAYTLQDGETLDLQCNIQLSALQNSDSGLRIGLFNSGNSRITSDGTSWQLSQFTDYTGYSIWLNPGATGSYTIKERTGTSTALYSSSASSTLGSTETTNLNLLAATSAPLHLSLIRSGNTLTIVGSLNHIAITRTDLTATSFSFDTFALQFGSTALASSETALLDSVKISALPSTLLHDTFATSRTIESLPDSARWALRGASGTTLTTVSNALEFTSTASTVNILTYFTATNEIYTIQDEETLHVSFDFELSGLSSSSDAIRIGLFNSHNSRVTTDGSAWMLSAFNTYDGYSTWFQPDGAGSYNIRERTGTSSALFSSSANTVLGTTGGADLNLTENEATHCILKFTRDGTNLLITTVLNGITISRTDPTASFDFDTLAVQMASTALSTGETLTLKNVVICTTQPGLAEITVDWNTETQNINPYIYSINSPACFFEDRVSDPDWHDLIDYMAPKMVRLHSTAIISKSWMFEGDTDWNYTNISNSLAAGALPLGTDRMITIYCWPDEYDTNDDGLLDSDKLDDFTTLCTNLLHYVNNELGYDVPYWEITNERDSYYWDLGTNGVQQLATIYNTVAAAMRTVDSSIKLGGPAACSLSPSDYLVQFAKSTSNQLDFISYHAYASADGSDSDYKIYNYADSLRKNAENFINQLDEEIPSNDIEIFIDEYNISAVWDNPEPRMRNNQGAVFDALCLIRIIQSGADGAHAWNAEDAIYGKGTLSGEVRPGAHIYQIFNTYLCGALNATTNSNPGYVTTAAMSDTTNGTKGVILVNRSRTPQSAMVTHQQTQTSNWQYLRVDAEGLTESSAQAPFSAPIELPPHSVIFFCQPAQ